MNQILNNFNNKEYSKNAISSKLSNNTYMNVSKNIPKNNIKIKKYKTQLIISIFILIIAVVLLIRNVYSYAKKENVSKNLLNTLSITKLYSNSQSYSTIDNNLGTNNLQNFDIINENDPFVIGIIQIEKINVNYPILSNTSKELLKVSLCRCAGPMPNVKGNLCIAGHNLVDYKLFSRLNEINLKDIIKIYDLNGNMIEYEVYKKYEVDSTDLSCLTQDTNENKIVTLLTCNNVNGKRLIVVAKEIIKK